jgi:NADH-quinone oxidoreductase subunit H
LDATTQFVIFSVIKIVAVFAVVMGGVSYAVLAERKISAFIQDRIGPNRVGPAGIWQPMADGVKSFLKEDFTPGHVRKIYFWLAPMITMIPALLVLAVIPFGSSLGSQKMVIADLNVGILYTFGIVSLGVYGIILAGYASNSKYPFLGGIRSSAQMISYEIAMGMSVVPVFLIVGDLNLGNIIEHQAQHGWLIFYAPVSFIIFMVSSFAETNRLPFDLPESEQELVAGYNTEYSSMKFALFFMGEYTNMIAASAMMVTLFLGGWTLPFAGLDNPHPSKIIGLVQIAIFLGKIMFLMGIFIWVRWMWPRFRYDQLMDLGWRRFLPISLLNIVATAMWLWAFAR